MRFGPARTTVQLHDEDRLDPYTTSFDIDIAGFSQQTKAKGQFQLDHVPPGRWIH